MKAKIFHKLYIKDGRSYYDISHWLIKSHPN